jgi:hypothetical protein
MLIKPYLLQNTATTAPIIVPMIETAIKGNPITPAVQATERPATLPPMTAMPVLDVILSLKRFNADASPNASSSTVCCLLVFLSLACYNKLY